MSFQCHTTRTKAERCFLPPFEYHLKPSWSVYPKGRAERCRKRSEGEIGKIWRESALYDAVARSARQCVVSVKEFDQSMPSQPAIVTDVR